MRRVPHGAKGKAGKEQLGSVETADGAYVFRDYLAGIVWRCVILILVSVLANVQGTMFMQKSD